MVIIPYTCILENSKFYEDVVEVGVSDGVSSGEGFVAGGGSTAASPFALSARSVSVEDCSPAAEASPFAPSAGSFAVEDWSPEAEVFSASPSSMISSAYTSGCSLKQSCIALNFSTQSIPLGSASENTKQENASRN